MNITIDSENLAAIVRGCILSMCDYSCMVQSMVYTPKPGDVVVIDGYIDYGKPIVKRIIALGGDVVDIDAATNAVSVNGKVLDEPYISAPTTPGTDLQ